MLSAFPERTSENLLDEFCEEFDYMPIVFNSFQSHGSKRKLFDLLYTNVMMCVAA